MTEPESHLLDPSPFPQTPACKVYVADASTTMAEHKTVEGVWGPGTHADTEFIPLVKDCERLLKHVASISSGFTKDAKALEDVNFHGGDLTILPGPIKAQALVSCPQLPCVSPC